MSAAAVIILRRKKLVRRFTELGATSGDKAIPFEDVGMRRSWIFDQNPRRRMKLNDSSAGEVHGTMGAWLEPVSAPGASIAVP